MCTCIVFIHPFTHSSGEGAENRGKAFVVYEDIYDSKTALEHLNGFNVLGRYLIVLYYQQTKTIKAVDTAAKKKELDELKARFAFAGGGTSKEKLDS